MYGLRPFLSISRNTDISDTTLLLDSLRCLLDVITVECVKIIFKYLGVGIIYEDA